MQSDQRVSDGGSLPLIQLRPHEIIKQQSRTNLNSFRENDNERTRATTSNMFNVTCKQQTNANASRYSNHMTNFTQGNLNITRGSAMSKRNPYSDLNTSQIEFTNNKRDYSPIITTSKYDLRRIYDPYSKTVMDRKSNDNISIQNLSRLGRNQKVSNTTA